MKYGEFIYVNIASLVAGGAIHLFFGGIGVLVVAIIFCIVGINHFNKEVEE